MSGEESRKAQAAINSLLADPTLEPALKGLIAGCADKTQLGFTIDKTRVQAGKTFSGAALAEAEKIVSTFIHARIMWAWALNDRPPVKLEVEIRVVAT